MELSKNVISINSNLLDVLKKIDQSSIQTVFVVNDNNEVIGVITDGDIRRGLIKGLDLIKTEKLTKKVENELKNEIISLKKRVLSFKIKIEKLAKSYKEVL